MEVEGLRANGPGDKAKVFGMQEGQDDYITNRYRVDIQYRGTDGFPANAIQFRVLYGDDPCCKDEPDTAVRFAFGVLLDPSTAYYWKFTWGRENGEVRTVLKEGGITGTTRSITKGCARRTAGIRQVRTMPTSAPRPAAAARIRVDSGTIYRNVWLSSRSRPATLGSALRGREHAVEGKIGPAALIQLDGTAVLLW